MKRALSRCLSFLLTLLLFCTSVIGCGQHQSDPSPSAGSDETALTSPSGQHTFLSLTASKKKEINIVFMGNSITQTGNLPLHFTYLDPSRNIKVTEMSKGGYRLSNHMDRLDATTEEKAFKDIDMVVLQEYGGYYPSYITTSELISKIGKDKKYYTFTSMLEGVYDWSFQQEILTTLNVILVVTPVLQYDSSLTKSDFMMSDNVHPTSLYGYVNALALYCKIFNVKATEQNNGCLTAYDIPGSTAEEDAAYMARLKKAVQRMLDDQREA